jgi:hypothetical protein
MDVVLVPDRPVREPDLPPHHPLAPRLPKPTNLAGDTIGVLEREAAGAGGEGGDLRAGVEGAEEFGGEWGSGHGSL